MKKQIFSIKFIIFLSFGLVCIPSICSQDHTKIGGVEQDHIFNTPFYAFHEHEINPEIAQTPEFKKPAQPSLYERYNNLPVRAQNHITGYLKKITEEEVDPETGQSEIVEDMSWKLNRKEYFRVTLEKWDEKDLGRIKECLREEYWDRYVKRARGEHIMIHNNTRMVPSELTKIICYKFDRIGLSIPNVLYNPCASKYPEHDFEIASLMIACGALVNYKSSEYFNSLYYAIEKDNVMMVDLLMSHGLIQTGKLQGIPMHTAAASNSCKVIRYLHEKGHDINSQQGSDHGETPLHRAYFFGQQAAVNLLTALGADTKIKDKWGKIYCNRDTLAAQIARDKKYSDLREDISPNEFLYDFD